MEYFLAKAKTHLALVIFHLLFLIILLTNFPFGSSFIGWDSIHPEFNFSLNLERAFTATWQENYGTGTITGHGFGGTLPHTIVTYLLSFILPTDAIRPTFTFIMLYLGGLGMYLLVKLLFLKITKSKPSPLILDTKYHIPFIALLSSLFYMVNLGTIQIFYVQLETFIGHYASLPWLFYILILVLEKITPKRLLIFCLIAFFSTLQAFIPSLFLAYAVALAIFLATYLFTKKFSLPSIKKTSIVIILTGIVNSFWLIPLLVYQATQNAIFLTSFNNVNSTQHFIDVNKKYGDAADVALLKGYLFDTHQLGDYVLRPWIDHLDLIIPALLGYIFFGVILTGLGFALLKIRNWQLNAFTLIFLFFFGSIATNTQPFASIVGALQWISPTYEQAFRTAFTKFSIGTSFTMSIFFGIGLVGIIHIATQFNSKKLTHSLIVITLFSLLLYSLPVFKGHLLYNNLKITIPEAYYSVMDYFKEQGDGRIADFPQECADGWYAYKWGYFGSGFYWYGIKQSFMSRSFDVWNRNSENYYWEITTALNNEDYKSAVQVLKKYHIRWILYDPNTYYCNSQKGLLIQEAFIEYLNKSPDFKKEDSFESNGVSPIVLFQSTNSMTYSYATQTTEVKNIGPVTLRSENDKAFKFDGDYITTPTAPYTAYYPFASLLTKRGEILKYTNITENEKTTVITTQLPQGLKGYKVRLQKYRDVEQIVPATLTVKKGLTTGAIQLKLSASTPEITLDNKKLWAKRLELQLGTIRASESGISIYVNGKERTLDTKSKTYEAVLFTTIDNTIEIKDKKNTQLLKWESANDPAFTNFIGTEESLDIPQYTQGELAITIPKITGQETYSVSMKNTIPNTKPVPCNEIRPSKRNRYEAKEGKDTYLRLTSTDSSQCVNLFFPQLFTNNGYLVKIVAKNIKGNTPRLSIYQNARTIYGPHPLPIKPTFTDTYLILPPTLQKGIGYEAQIVNASENNNDSVNDIQNLSLSYLPYKFLKEIRLATANTLIPQASKNTTVTSSHPDATRYEIKEKDLTNTESSMLILNQSFHPGWHAYKIDNTEKAKLLPFIFGTELKNHTTVNGWANGWLHEKNTNPENSIIIIFLPQYAQYAAFIILALTFTTLIIFFLQNTLKTRYNDNRI